MSSIPKQIVDNLTASLTAITIANGYSCNVFEVNDRIQKQSEISQFITLNVIAQNDKLKDGLEENETREVDIIILAHCDAFDGDNILTDLTKFLYKDSTILSTYHNTLNTIPELLTATITLKNNNYVWQGNTKTVALVLQCQYYQERNNITGSCATMSVPNILNNYTLTSSFISATSNLQSQILSISGIAISGANTWGSIYGTLSAQTDLQTELNSRSLTGHSHNQYTLTSDFVSSTAGLTGATLLTRYSPSGWTYFVNKSDKVGIGYTQGTALGYTLDVSGKIRCTDNLYTNANLYADTAIWSPVFKPRYNTPFEFRNYTNQTLGIALSSGQWGIGTLTPTEKLSVSGNLSVTGNIIVNGLSGYNGTVTAGTTMTITNGIITSIS